MPGLGVTGDSASASRVKGVWGQENRCKGLTITERKWGTRAVKQLKVQGV
jgi:hypothetical protein